MFESDGPTPPMDESDVDDVPPCWLELDSEFDVSPASMLVPKLCIPPPSVLDVPPPSVVVPEFDSSPPPVLSDVDGSPSC